MALSWEWTDKMGTALIEGFRDQPDYEVNIYQGNALMIACYEDKEADTYQMCWFFLDKEHLRNCLGLSKGHDGCLDDNRVLWGIKKLKLNTKYKSVPVIISELAKAGVKIELELYRE